MKKLSLLLGLVLILALTVPAFAGVNTDITGSVSADAHYDQQDGLTADGSVEANIEMSAGSDGAIKAVVDLGTTTADNDGAFGGATSPFVAMSSVDLNIKSAYIQTTGAWLKGMPETTTKLGKFSVNYSDWVADLGSKDAVEVSGIGLGPVSLATYAGWYWDGAATQSLTAVSASGSLDIVDVTGTVVSDEGTASTDFAVEATASPAEGVTLNADFAGQGNPSASAYNVGGELATIPNLTLGASVWSADAAFAPKYADWEDDNDNDLLDAGEQTKFNPDEKGYELTADTTQAGVDLGVSYKNTTDAAGNGAVTTTTVEGSTTVSETDLSATVTMKTNTDTKIELEASRSFGDIKGTYKLTSQGGANTHEVIAETTLDTPIADAVDLKANVKLPAAGGTDFGVEASWTAPNGINLAVGYANYDREDDWAGGYDVSEDVNGADGFAVNAGIEVEF